MKENNFSLGDGYSVEKDRVNESEWTRLLSNFEDATLYQTWTYGVVRWGQGKLSHLVIKKGDNVVGLAQATIAKTPLIRAGIAYIPWGPLWRRKDTAIDLEDLRYVLRAIRHIYAQELGLLVRITPNSYKHDNPEIVELLKDEGYAFKRKNYRTFLLDLSPSLEALRKGFDQKWRNQLNRSEKNGLSVKEGTSVSLYDSFAHLYKEMMGRKQFHTEVSIDQFRDIQTQQPEELKFRVLICEYDGKPISGIVASSIGNTGIYLLGATGDNGLTLKGNYLLQWHMVKWLKKSGFKYYDLGGIDPEVNPGVYHFKSGLRGEDVTFTGRFESTGSRLSSFIVKAAEYIKDKR